VLEAVAELLKVRRVDELTVAEIVGRAGISRPTFYASFDTKYSVVAALIADVGDDIYDLWRAFFDADGPIQREPIYEAGIATMERWRAQGALFTATIEGWHTDPEIHAVWSAVLDRFSHALTERLHRAREPRSSDDILAASLVSAFERCVYLAVSTPDSVFARSDAELADVLADLWTRSLDAAGRPARAPRKS
jgi:AcrR family transcriptional regulator